MNKAQQNALEFSKATALFQQGRFAEAIPVYEAILRREPRNIGAANLLGIALMQTGRLEEAAAAIRNALRADPNQPDAHYNLAVVLQTLGRPDEAIVHLQNVIALKPDDPQARNNLGVVLKALGRFDEAIESYRKALGLSPNSAETRINLAAALFSLEQYEESLLQSEKALALNPGLAEAQMSCGRALQALHRYEEALPYINRTLEIDPERKDVIHNKSILCLSLERFSEGWKLYETRFTENSRGAVFRVHSSPRWNGKFVEGNLAVWGEQGVGDQILYASMVPDATTRAGTVTLEIDPRLISLFARSFPKAKFHSIDEDLGTIKSEAHTPIATLGEIFRPSADAFPKKAYLRADKNRADALRDLLPKNKIAIGISWRSLNPDFGNRKTAELNAFSCLFTHPDIEIVDLQYGDTTAEIEAIRKNHSGSISHLDEIDNMNDLDGLAALIEACDAVVTISNTTAHLAGALGKPVWVLVPYHGQGKLWYWFKDRKDSLWYPEARICRQQKGQSWASLIASVTPEIVEFLRTKKDGGR